MNTPVRPEDIEKVRGLMARTASDSDHEADTCRRLACQKIREMGLQIVGPQMAGSAFISNDVELKTLRDRFLHQSAAITNLRAELQKQKSVIDSLRLTCDAQQKKIAKLEGGEGGSPVPKKASTPRKPRAIKTKAGKVVAPSFASTIGVVAGRPPGPVATPPSNFRPADFKPSSGYESPPSFYDTKKIRAKYPSKCRGCGEQIDEGDEVIWTPQEGVECMRCGG
jgi:hypothetical protein